MGIGVAYCITVTMAVGLCVIGVSDVIILLLTESETVLQITQERFILLALTNFITCTMEVFSHAVRALKRPKYLLYVGVFCGFFIRSGWAWFIWPFHRSLPFLFVCFPLSTLIGILIYLPVYSSAVKKEEAALCCP